MHFASINILDSSMLHSCKKYDYFTLFYNNNDNNNNNTLNKKLFNNLQLNY